MELIHKSKHFSTSQIIVIGFLMVIMIGCLLLMLPIATASGEGASFGDALFTSTSAVCVTGLVTQNTATYWSMFGQVVIIILIQIGGMGVITLSVAIAMFSGRKIGLMQRSTMQEAIAAPCMSGIVRLTSFILKVSIAIELIGAAIMTPCFYKEFGLAKGIWYGIFHSISAFCNAGFDLMGINKPFCSLVEFSAQPTINLTIMLLIIIGGIGFLTWEDVRTNRFNIRKYRMQSKVILLTTALLIIFPALYFYFIEFSYEPWHDMSTKERVLASLFQTVTPRTAGFNTVDLSLLSESGQILTTLLMLIGAAPGSTAGGMKVTTIAVLFASTISVFRRSEHTHCFGRRIAVDTVKYAATILMMYMTLFLIGGVTISIIEKLPIIECLFETASAIGTVGLTLGITPELSAVSKAILIGLMYMGRVGGLTLVFATIADHHSQQSKFPIEKITVG